MVVSLDNGKRTDHGFTDLFVPDQTRRINDNHTLPLPDQVKPGEVNLEEQRRAARKKKGEVKVDPAAQEAVPRS